MIKYRLTMVNIEPTTFQDSVGNMRPTSRESEHCPIGLFESETTLINWLMQNRGTLEHENGKGK